MVCCTYVGGLELVLLYFDFFDFILREGEAGGESCFLGKAQSANAKRKHSKQPRGSLVAVGVWCSVADNSTGRVAFVWCVAFHLYFIIIMEDNGNNNNVFFVYMGGDQEVPEDVTHAIFDRSVDTIRAKAFHFCTHLLSIVMHDGVKLIEEDAFSYCESLRRGIKLSGVRVIGEGAFFHCEALANVEFGDKLDRIGRCAFAGTALRNIKIPKVRIIGQGAFCACEQLTDAELSGDLETIDVCAFQRCPRLRRIAMPLKDNALGDYVFDDCVALSTVDVVGGIHKTISSLPLDRWRKDMNHEIGRINQVLPKLIARIEQSYDGREASSKEWNITHRNNTNY